METIDNLEEKYDATLKQFEHTDEEYSKLQTESTINDFKDCIMVLDTETTGFPEKNGFYSYCDYTDITKYENARIVQFSWGLYDKTGNLHKLNDKIIKPNGFTIENPQHHNITTEIANDLGVDIKEVLVQFSNDLKKTSTIVGHNLMFDENVILSELYRLNMLEVINEFKQKIKNCTGIGTQHLLKIPMNFESSNPSKKYKMPTLEELYFWCFDKEIDKTHNSKYDVIHTAECYFYIKSGKYKNKDENSK